MVNDCLHTFYCIMVRFAFNFIKANAEQSSRTYAGAGESFSKPYSNDLNSELDYCITGMFNKDTLNAPSEIKQVGLFTNFRAKFYEGEFLFQILIPITNPFLYVRVRWDKTWYNWRKVALTDVIEG